MRVSKNRRPSLSAAPLSRGFRNVTWQDVFRYAPFTLGQRQYKYKQFSIHNVHKYLFCSVSLLIVAEWSRVEWSGLEWSRGHWLRSSETLRKPWFRSVRANFIVKHMKFELFWDEASIALSGSFARLEKRYRTKPFRSKIWENWEPPQEERETCSVLAFLKLLLREACEKSSSFNRRSKKRYWANVSEASSQSQDAARSVFRRAKREFGVSLDRRPRIDNFWESSNENDIYAGAFEGCFAVTF